MANSIPVRKTEIRFTIPRVPLSRNKLDTMHWAARGRESGTWKEELWASVQPSYRFIACDIRFPVTKSGKKRGWKSHVTIRTVWAKRRLDDDNFRGGCKPILDALKTNGLIFNDSPKWLTAEYTQDLASKAGGKPRTEICVKGLP